MSNLWSGVIDTHNEYIKFSEISGVTFEEGKTYIIQINGSCTLIESSALPTDGGFLVNTLIPVAYTKGSGDLYVKGESYFCTLNLAEGVSSGGGGSANIESLSITPTTSAQTITASGGVDGYSPVNVSAVTADIDANIVAGNIKKDVSILGVTGTYEGSGGGSKYGATAGTFLGDVDANGVLQLPTEQSDLVFTGVTDVAKNGLYYKFYYDKVKSISFPNLTTLSGSRACSYMLSGCTALTSLSFPSLTIISGSRACNYMLQNCTALTSLSFPSLTTISGLDACSYMLQYCTALTSASFPNLTTISGDSGCQYMFSGSTALTDAYFNSLTTTSFGSYTNQFSNMMYQTGSAVTHTLHFPSNLQSTISGLTGYPTFGGTSGYVVLAFDLPATS